MKASRTVLGPLLAVLAALGVGCASSPPDRSDDDGGEAPTGDGGTDPGDGADDGEDAEDGDDADGDGPPGGPVGAGGDGAAPTGVGGAAHGTGGGVATGGGDPGEIPWPSPDWSSGVPEEHGLDPAILAQAEAVAEAEGSTCLLVLRHGVIVAERYWQGRDAASAEPSWSIAKSYASAVVGIAIERGDIASLDAPVADYVPAWSGTVHQAVTIRHLISMTSGLAWSAFSDYVSMATFADDHTAYALDLEQDAAPGATWTYHNGGVQVLEAVFRGATGGTIEDYARTHLWSRIGSNASWGHDPAGNPTAYANVLATCRDHARLGYLYLHGGRWGAEQVLPAAWIEATLTPSQEENRAYGFLWWLNGEAPAMDAMKEPWEGALAPYAPADLFAARGFGNQFVDVIPSLDLMVVRFAPDPAGGGLDLGELAEDQHFEEHDAILRAVLQAVVD